MQSAKFENLIRLLKLVGGKFIIVEEGEPKAVLMTYQEFQELAVPYYAGKIASRLMQPEQVNEEITRAQLADLREEIIAEVIQPRGPLGTEPELRIEPLVDGEI